MNALKTIVILLIETAAVAGFYASPAILYRYAMKQAGSSPAFAKRFNLFVTAAFAVLTAAVLLISKQGLIPMIGLLWFPMNYGILTSGYVDENGNAKKSGPIVALFDRLQEIVVYIIVGVFTTVVSWAVFYILTFVLDSSNGFQLSVNTVLNWCAGVLVAYPMNRVWVFHSTNPKKLKEFIGFAASRVTTLLIEEVVMLLCVDVLGIDQYLSKYVIASILVMVLNYVFSKLLVFSKGRSTDK